MRSIGIVAGLLCAGFAGFASVGCSAGGADAETDIVRNEDHLYGGGSLAKLWTINNKNVPVCFTQAGNATLRALTREILEDTWSRVTPVRFTGFGTCSSTSSSALPNTVAITFTPDTRGFSNVGRFDSGWTGTTVTSNDPGVRFRYEVMHEVGHALGFEHDQVRPDNWSNGKPVFCNQFNPDEVGGLAGGVKFSNADNASIMSYCSGFSSALSARDVVGARVAYGSSKTFSCQDLSDVYGIRAGVSFGFAPSSVQTSWISQGCNVAPSSPDSCQKASDLYGINAGVTFGFAPANVRTWWVASGCNTKPVSSVGLCQRASQTYGITASQTFGSAPPEVQTWWTSNNCNAEPRNQDACQRLSDYFGISPSENGWAPSSTVSWFQTHRCQTSPSTERCQLLSDVYGVDAGVTFAAAPTAARNWWTSHSCNTHPTSGNSCQRASDAFAINAGVSFGFAPPEVQSWWVSAKCDAHTTAKNPCQAASDRYGIVAGVTFAAAPPEVQSWWVAQGCNTRPVDAAPIPG